MTEKEFIEEIKKIGITPTTKQLEKLNKYYELLVEYNKKVNLTRITEKKEVYLKHFYDSLTITKIVDLNQANTLLDFGTGAGFPGVVLKIFYDSLEVTLVDSLKKRITFLDTLIEELKLKKVRTIHTRVEELEKKHYDIITTRAVANLQKIIIYTKNLIDNKTLLIPMKAHIEEELQSAKFLLKKYKLQVIKRETFYLPYENSIRNILLIKKNKS